MRILAFIILLSFSVNAQESGLGWMFINTNTIKADKQEHFAGGFYIGLSAYSLTLGNTDGNRKKAKFWGIVTPILVGTLKELSDSRKTGFDWADLGYTAGVGIVATYTFDFLRQRHKRRNK